MDRHRENDLPAVIYSGGLLFWYINGELQRGEECSVIIMSDETIPSQIS